MICWTSSGVAEVFDTTVVVTGFKDNLIIAITDAEWQTCVGIVRFAAADGATVVTGDIWNKTNLDLSYKCAAGSTSLFGVMIARAGYTPASGEVFTFRVSGEVN